MNLKSVNSIKNLKNKVVLLYVDFDLQIINNQIIDDRKIREIIDTLEYLIYSNSKIVLFSKTSNFKFSDLIIKRVEYLLKLNKKFDNNLFLFTEDKLESLKTSIKKINSGDIIILNSIDSCDFKNFYKQFDLFVFENFNDFFTQEKNIVFLTKKLNLYFGLSFLKKYEQFLKIKFNNNVCVVGGEYGLDKINFISNLLEQGSTILLGGDIASTFVKVYLYRSNKKNVAKSSNSKVVNLLKKFKKRIILPIDFIVSKTRYKDVSFYRKELKELDKYEYIFDIGPETIKLYSNYLKKAKNIIWSGLMGFAEDKKFSHGSSMMAQIFSNKSKGPAYGVVVGNRTCDFIKTCKYSEDVDFMFYEKNTIYNLVNEVEVNIKI